MSGKVRDCMADSVLGPEEIEALESFSDGSTTDCSGMLEYLGHFISKGVSEGRFTEKQAHHDLGIALWVAYACNNLDDYEHYYTASEWLSRVEDIASGCGVWYYRYANALMYCGKPSRALEYCERGIREDPDYPWTWLTLGRLRSHFGDRRGAEEANGPAVWHPVAEKERALLEKISAVPHRTLKGNALWALGIVTGDNRRFLADAPEPGAEPILCGSDIHPFAIGRPRRFLRLGIGKFQQAAPLSFYRTPGKLVYRFISDRPVFALDREGILTLNSANLLLPRLDGIAVLRKAAVLEQVPVSMVLTGFLTEYAANTAATLGVRYFMAKPCQFEAVAERLQEILQAEQEKENWKNFFRTGSARGAGRGPVSS